MWNRYQKVYLKDSFFKLIKKILIPILLSISFLALFFVYVPLDKVIDSFSHISLNEFFLAFFFYTASQIIRSFRWLPLMRGLSFLDIYLINSANIFFNNVLPARTGELSWFYYAKKLGVPLKFSIWSFLLGRFFDLLALIFMALFLYTIIEKSVLTFLISFIVVFLSLFFHKVYLFLPSWGKLGSLKSYLRDNTSFRLSSLLFLCSTFSVVFKFVAIVQLLSVSSYLLSFLSFSFGELSSVLPLHSFMGYGTYEISFSIPAKFASADMKKWLVEGFIAHNFLLLSSAFYGILSVFLLHRKN